MIMHVVGVLMLSGWARCTSNIILNWEDIHSIGRDDSAAIQYTVKYTRKTETLFCLGY
jgi:hypothetical protein